MNQPIRLLLLSAPVWLAGSVAAQTPPAESDFPFAQAQEGDTQAAPTWTLETAWRRHAELDALGAMEGYAALLQERAAALGAGSTNADAIPTEDAPPPMSAAERARTAAELEFLAVAFARAAERCGDDRLIRGHLDAIDLPERYGMAWARLQWRHPEAAERLAMLTRWEFIGPFDNEQGAAMQAALAPESSPGSSESHLGKVRPVTWRTTPQTAYEDGRVPFGRLVHPHRQAAVLARTWVRSETEQDAWLLLGVSEEARAWVNGQAVLEADGEHQRRMDALAAPVRLNAGWNEIAVKVGSRDEEPVLQARLVDAGNAAPLRLDQSAVVPEGHFPHMLNQDPAPRWDPAARPGALGFYARDESPEGRYRLSVLQDELQTGPRSEHPGLEAARAAVNAQPERLRYAVQLIQVLAPGREYQAEELDVNPWLQAVHATLELDPGQPTALMHLLRQAQRFQKSWARAEKILDRMEARVPGAIHVPYLRAVLAREADMEALEPLFLERVLEHAAVNQHPQFLEYAAMRYLGYGTAERTDALREVFTANRSFSSLRAIHERAFAGEAQFDAEAFLARLQQRLDLRPWSSEERREAARVFLQEGDTATATALIEDALAIKPESPRNLKLAARIHLAAGDTEAAIRALEDELDVDYSAADERRLLEHLRTLEGSSFEEPYREPLDAVLTRHDEREDAATVRAEAGREILLYRTVVRVNPDGTASRYFRKVVRVLNDNGVRELDRERFRYAYGDQELRVLRAAVRGEDGSEEQASTGRGWRNADVDLPPLEPGDVVDLEWRVDDLRVTFFGQYFGFDHALTPDRTVPVHRSEVVLLVPEELPLEFHTRHLFPADPEITEAGDWGTEYAWSADNLMPTRSEPLMTHAAETVPRVQASSYANWEEFGNWWWNLIEDGITVSPEMSAKVASLTENRSNRREQVRAIYEFVANDVRYNAWEFGVHGYQPYSAPVIFSRKFGDCKDKAILLRAMLSQIGVEAYPVLIRRSGTRALGGRRHDEDLSLALVSHFNHCIAYLPEQEGLPAMWVDGTARLHPMDVLPFDDRGAEVLVVRPDGVARAEIPFTPAGENPELRHFRVAMNADGSANVAVTVEPGGRFDPRWRQSFDGGAEENRERAEEWISGIFGPMAGTLEFDIPDVENLAADLRFRFSGRAEQVARPAGGALELPASLDHANLMQSLATESERHTDLLLDHPFRRETVLEFTGMQGWNLDALGADGPVEVQTPDANYTWTLERTENGVRIHEVFELRTHRIPVERYADFRELCRTVDQTQDQYLRVVPRVD